MNVKNFSNLQQKIIPKNKHVIKDKFSMADLTLETGLNENNIKDVVTRKTFSLPKYEEETFKKIKDRALDYRVILSDSEIIRIGLLMLDQLDDSRFQEKILNLKKIRTGRPKKN